MLKLKLIRSVRSDTIDNKTNFLEDFMGSLSLLHSPTARLLDSVYLVVKRGVDDLVLCPATVKVFLYESCDTNS